MSFLDKAVAECKKYGGKFAIPFLPRNNVEGVILFTLLAIPVPVSDSLWWAYAAGRLGVEQAGRDFKDIKADVQKSLDRVNFKGGPNEG